MKKAIKNVNVVAPVVASVVASDVTLVGTDSNFLSFLSTVGKLATPASDFTPTKGDVSIKFLHAEADTNTIKVDSFKHRKTAERVRLSNYGRENTFGKVVAQALALCTNDNPFKEQDFIALCNQHAEKVRNVEATKKRFIAGYIKYFAGQGFAIVESSKVKGAYFEK